MMETFRRLWSDAKGADLVEYALAVLLLSIVSMTVLRNIGCNITTVLTDESSALTTTPVHR